MIKGRLMNANHIILIYVYFYIENAPLDNEGVRITPCLQRLG